MIKADLNLNGSRKMRYCQKILPIFAAFVAIFAVACQEEHGSSSQTANANHVQPSYIIEEHLTDDPSNDLGKAIDEGHQPWRLEPGLVAQLWLEFCDTHALPETLRDRIVSISKKQPLLTPILGKYEQLASWDDGSGIRLVVHIHGTKTPRGANIWEANRLEIFLSDVVKKTSP